MAALILACPAKINLTLEVLGRYPDGYHQIASVMQAISLADTLTLEPANEITFECDPPALAGPDNLVVRAARLLKETTGYRDGARLHLCKGIPEAAGLGGGSSDAAAALRGLDQLWGLGLPAERLLEMAAGLGSDAPFFLYGGTGLAEGRGEQLTPLPAPATTWLVLARPPVALPDKTRKLYGALTPLHYSRGERTQAMAEALREGRPLTGDMFFNVFEAVAPAAFPGIEEYKARLREAGGVGVHLAGSGPTIYAQFETKTRAEETLAKLEGLEVYLARTLGAAN